MENPAWCSLDGPCNNISDMIVDIVQNGSNIVQNIRHSTFDIVQNGTMGTTTTNLANTTCNGSLVNGECLVRKMHTPN